MRKIVWLDQVELEDRSRVGGKSLRLAELMQAGFRVPKAFCLTTEVYRDFLRSNDLMQQLGLMRLGRDKSILKDICARVAEEILQGEISGEVRKGVSDALKETKADRLAVRSSATCEDLQLASFAGQFDSYLDLLRDQVLEAVRKCWASVFSNRVLTYTLFHGIELRVIEMAVIVQEMIEAEKGGVMFTKDVLNGGSNDVIIIEASEGSADDVVSGLVEPERVLVNQKTKKQIGKTASEGGVLSQKEVERLVELGQGIEDHFSGVPQDIEWVIKDDKIYVLQARPITT